MPDILRYGMKRAHLRVRTLPCCEADDSRAYRLSALPGPHLDNDDANAYGNEGQSSQKKDDFHSRRLWRGVSNSLRFLCAEFRSAGAIELTDRFHRPQAKQYDPRDSLLNIDPGDSLRTRSSTPHFLI